MNVNWFNLAIDGVFIYAVVEAVAAARRVSDKRQQTRSAQKPVDQPSPFQAPSLTQAVQPPPAPSEVQTIANPANQSTDQSEATSKDTTANSASTESMAHPVAGSIAALATDLDLPLAVSLAVSDVIEADAPLVTSSLELDLVPPELEIPELESAAATHRSVEHHSVLAEIAELGQTDSADIISQLRRYLEHPDDGIRAATVFELGELATKRQGSEAAEIMELLTQLGQDANPLVREQALLAWAKVQPIISEI